MFRVLIFIAYLMQLSLQETVAQKLPNLIPYHNGKLWGYCDSNKNVIIQPKYNLNVPKSKGIASFPFFADTSKQAVIVLGDRDIVIDRNGKELSNKKVSKPKPAEDIETITTDVQVKSKGRTEYDRIADGYFKIDVVNNNQEHGIFEYKYPIGNNFYRCFSLDEETKKLIDKDGITIYKSCKYIWPVDSVFIIVEKNGQWSLGDRYGKVLTTDTYDYISGLLEYNEDNDEDKEIYSSIWGKYLIVEKKGYKGVITVDGKLLIPPKKYKNIWPVFNCTPGLFSVSYEKGVGYIDYKGTEYWKE